MKKTKFTEEQILFALKQGNAGQPVADVCRQMRISDVAGRGDAGKRGSAGSAAKTVVSAPARRELVRWMKPPGLSERLALPFVGMSASRSLSADARSQPALREKIVQLAHRHRRYGVGMIYFKLRQSGHCVNYKHVERLYVTCRPSAEPSSRRRRLFLRLCDSFCLNSAGVS